MSRRRKGLEDTKRLVDSSLCDGQCKRDRKYTKDEIQRIRNIYLIGIMVWIFIAWIICEPRTAIEVVILLVPLVLFFIDYVNIPFITVDTEDLIFEDNYLSIALLVIIPFFTNIAGKKEKDPRILPIVIFAIGMLL